MRAPVADQSRGRGSIFIGGSPGPPARSGLQRQHRSSGPRHGSGCVFTGKGLVGNMPLDFNVGASVVGVASISNHVHRQHRRRSRPEDAGLVSSAKHPRPRQLFTVWRSRIGGDGLADNRHPTQRPGATELTVYCTLESPPWGGVRALHTVVGRSNRGYSASLHGCVNLGYWTARGGTTTTSAW